MSSGPGRVIVHRTFQQLLLPLQHHYSKILQYGGHKGSHVPSYPTLIRVIIGINAYLGVENQFSLECGNRLPVPQWMTPHQSMTAVVGLNGLNNKEDISLRERESFLGHEKSWKEVCRVDMKIHCLNV